MSATFSGNTPAIPAHVPAECVVDVDVYRLPGVEQDVHGAWTAFQRSAPSDLVWTPHNGGHWIATRGEYVHALIGDWRHFSNHANTVPPEIGEGSAFIPLQLDPPEHTAYRSLVTKGFGLKFLMQLDAPIRELTTQLIDGMRDRGECEFVSEFAEVLPITVFLLLVGLPVSDRPMLRALGEQLNRPDGSMTGAELMRKMNDYLTPFVVQRLKAPGDDLLSRILAMPIEGRAWTYEEAMRMCRNLLFGGLDTVVAMIGFTTLYLARHPDKQDELRGNPDLIPAAADEFIRRFSSVLLTREVIEDYVLGGVTLKAGDLVVLPTMLHNLDDRCFPHAMDVDFRRGVVQHSTMGNGPHRCVGAALARMEVITFLQEWTSKLPAFEVHPAKPVKMQGGGVGAVTELPLRWPARGAA